MGQNVTQMDLIFEYFKKHPNKDVLTPDVVDWATAEYKRITGKPLRDPDRAIRSLHSKGKLIKVRNGCYRYSPDELKDDVSDEFFTEAQKNEILKLGEYRCAICGVTQSQGTDLHVDHVVPKSKGGKATIENGQVLCGAHNNLKKNYGQTETCKRMYKILYKQAKNLGDRKMLSFLDDVMNVYDKHGINSHIKWNPRK